MEIRFLRLGIPAIVVALCGYAGAQASQQKLQLVSANAQLIQNLDSKTATQGQVVTAKLTSSVKNGGSVELPKGTTLIGKIDDVQKSSGNGPTRLSIVFDQAKLRDGRTVQIKATLLSASLAGAGQYFAETGSSGSLVPQQPHLIPADDKVDQAPGLLSHVSLHSEVASDASGVFTSYDQTIDLKRGTQFQIAIAPEASPSQAEAGAQ